MLLKSLVINEMFYSILIVLMIFVLIQVKQIYFLSFVFYFDYLEFIESWRKISVEGQDDKKILEFLNNHGHYGLEKNAPRQTVNLIDLFLIRLMSV